MPGAAPESRNNSFWNADYPTIPNNDYAPMDHLDARDMGINAQPDFLPSQTRQRPSIAYLRSGMRDSLDRSLQRNYSSLVIIIPPAMVATQTFPMGPHHRLSDGLIMPLFPTFYGQLCAIAREYNFPSITGLFLYIRHVEDGVTMTPRLSEDIWSTIWSRVLNPSKTSTEHGIPISGSLEFDIDLRQARWYASWVSKSLRESVGDPAEMSIFNLQSTITTDNTFSQHTLEQPEVNHQGSQKYNALKRGHFPKKLSLLENFEPGLVHSQAFHAFEPGTKPSNRSQPNRQASRDSEQFSERTSTRVKSWRAESLAAQQHTPTDVYSSDPLSLITDSLACTHHERHISEEQAQSMIPAGSDVKDSSSLKPSPIRIPSFDSDCTLENSPHTPSVATSWGPETCSIISEAHDYYIFTPDLGRRNVFSPPETPMTATSWGPRSWNADSDVSSSPVYPPSIHMAYRGEFSRPVTPSTATSWGPVSWGASSVMSSSPVYPPSIHIAYRGEFSRPVTPSTATSWGPPSSYPPSPALRSYIHTPGTWSPWSSDFGDNQLLSEQLQRSQDNLYPYINIYPSVYPHFSIYPPISGQMEKDNAQPLQHQAGYDEALLIVPTESQSVGLFEQLQELSFEHGVLYPYINIYPAVYEHGVLYPYINIYPAVYPQFSIYPSISGQMADIVPQTIRPRVDNNVGCSVVPIGSQEIVSFGYDTSYPYMFIYPMIYPQFCIYPPVAGQMAKDDERFLQHQVNENIHCCITDSHPQRPLLKRNNLYPYMIIYPVLYPHFCLYPSIPGQVADDDSQLRVENTDHKMVHNGPQSTEPIKKLPNLHGLSFHLPTYLRNPNKLPSGLPLKTESRSNVGNTDLYLPTGPMPPIAVHLHAYASFNLYPPIYPDFDLYPVAPNSLEF